MTDKEQADDKSSSENILCARGGYVWTMKALLDILGVEVMITHEFLLLLQSMRRRSKSQSGGGGQGSGSLENPLADVSVSS